MARREWPLLQAAVVPSLVPDRRRRSASSRPKPPTGLRSASASRRSSGGVCSSHERKGSVTARRLRSCWSTRRSGSASCFSRSSSATTRRVVGTLTAMPFGLGIWEILILAGVLVLLFGAKGAPAMARRLGTGVREMRDAVNDMRSAHVARSEGRARDGEGDAGAGGGEARGRSRAGGRGGARGRVGAARTTLRAMPTRPRVDGGRRATRHSSRSRPRTARRFGSTSIPRRSHLPRRRSSQDRPRRATTTHSARRSTCSRRRRHDGARRRDARGGGGRRDPDPTRRLARAACRAGRCAASLLLRAAVQPRRHVLQLTKRVQATCVSPAACVVLRAWIQREHSVEGRGRGEP